MITKIKKVKDPGSAVTHFIGMMMAIFSSIPLLVRAGKNPGHAHTINQHDTTLFCKHNISYPKHFRKSQPKT